MIYALTCQDQSDFDRQAIAQAIYGRDHRTIESYAKNNVIVHIRDYQPEATLFCVYCQDVVRPTKARGPRKASAIGRISGPIIGHPMRAGISR